jgi:hypothetical protein
MTDISITAANVLQGSGARTEEGFAGETIAAGKVVYKDTTGKFMLADSDSATAAVRTPYGIALNSASLKQPITIQKSGEIAIGGTLTAGLAYYLSKTPGGICPVADIASGGYSSVIGMAKSTSVLDINIQSSGVAV